MNFTKKELRAVKGKVISNIIKYVDDTNRAVRKSHEYKNYEDEFKKVDLFYKKIDHMIMDLETDFVGTSEEKEDFVCQLKRDLERYIDDSKRAYFKPKLNESWECAIREFANRNFDIHFNIFVRDKWFDPSSQVILIEDLISSLQESLIKEYYNV